MNQGYILEQLQKRRLSVAEGVIVNANLVNCNLSLEERRQKKVTAEELRIFVQDKLADYKRPRDIRFIDELPLTPSGKIDKKVIRSKFIHEKD